MILDLRQLDHGTALQADVCIVGAGAAGIALALELADSGLEVLLLEAGGLAEEKATQRLYEGRVLDERLHSPAVRYRQRRFGGTTTIWGGRCVPLDPIDFESRDYVPGSGWPLAHDELLPWFRRANELCECGASSWRYEEALPPPHRPMIDGFSGLHYESDRLERFSRPTNFGVRYLSRLRTARHVRVILHANVTHLGLDATGREVESLQLRSLAGHCAIVRAGCVVLAVGGLETPRLLLSSDDVMPRGIGNGNDLVGRYYMCHLAGCIGTLRFDGSLPSVWHGYDITADGIYCRRRLSLSAQAQRAHRVGNFAARLHHPRITDPAHCSAILSALFLAKFLIPYEYGKRLHGEEHVAPGAWLGHLRNVLARPFDAAGFAVQMLRDRLLAARKFPSIVIRPRANLYSLDFHAEQLPNRDSRVVLDETRDTLGMRRLCIDWRYTGEDVRGVSVALRLLAEDLQRSGVGRFDYDEAGVEAEMTRYGAYGGHHIGTTRMGSDPRTSVVDADCRVHGVSNLYVAGSAVFPTSGQANPTLAIVALALRLADHLRTSIRTSRNAGTA